jgi:rSAM/selenodomain-associated transferase 1
MSGRTELVVMAKAPEAGRAKTRLVPALGPDGAARLAARLLEHALAGARAARFDAVVLACAPDTAHEAFAAQQAQGGVVLVAQGDGDLGARMRRQFERAFAAGAGRVVLIGTDIPALDAATLDRAADALADTDAVFAPAADGGYGLIGLRGVAPAWLFDAMPWSTPAVMAATRQRLARAGWRHVELPLVHDIDEPADLAHLPPGFAL